MVNEEFPCANQFHAVGCLDNEFNATLFPYRMYDLGRQQQAVSVEELSLRFPVQLAVVASSCGDETVGSELRY
jgi:hypothetical protein